MDLLNALVAFLNFVVVPATAYGAQLALGALGVTLIYGILRFSNFAHGDTMALGTTFAILLTWGFQSVGIGFGPLPTALLALPFAIGLTALFVLGTDRAVYRFYRAKKANPSTLVIVSLGVMFVMNGITRFIIGVQDQNFADGERFVVTARGFREATGLADGLAIRTTQVVTLVVALLLLQVYAAFVGALESLPLLPGLLELVGLVWLLSRGLPQLLRSSERERLMDHWTRRWRAFRGDV